MWQAIGAGILVVAGLLGPLRAQQAASGDSASTPVVTFTLDFPESEPSHYSIAVDARGHASYECTAKLTDEAEAEAYRAEFEMSAENRERIFDWAKEAKYFAGKIDSNRKVAFTGTKTLSYREGERLNSASYNFSNLEPVRQVTVLFQNIAATLDYGRRLSYYHRYQKLALDDELKHMEADAKSNELREIQALAPVLQEILDDASVMNVVRARAKQLIQMGSSGSPGH